MTTDIPYDYTDPGVDICDLGPRPEEVTARTYAHIVICAFGLVGNVLVIITYVFYKKTKTMTDVYLFNVAVSDLMFVVALPFIAYNEWYDWPMGSAACKALRSAYSVNLYSGMLLLACISGDRYVAIVRARRSFGSRSSSLLYGRLICAVVWAAAGALTLPTLMYSQRIEDVSLIDSSVSVTCEMSFSASGTARLVKVLVPALQMAVGFMLPLVVMLFCYSCVACTLLRAQSSQRHKAIRVVLAVVVVFVACHLPYNAALLSRTLVLFRQRDCDGEKLRLRVLAVTRSVAYLHCCLNPVLYAFIGVKFRSHFCQIAKDVWCFSKKYITSARSSRGTSDICVSGIRSSEISNNMSTFTA